MTHSARHPVGSVVSLWRYPVKSMLGEELNASNVTERGLAGDRAYALVDSADGKIASAKNPRKWPRMFQFRAALAATADLGDLLPAVRITLPNGDQLSSEQADHDERLSGVLDRAVTLQAAGRGDRQPAAASSRGRRAATAEEYWPDMDGLDYRDDNAGSGRSARGFRHPAHGRPTQRRQCRRLRLGRTRRQDPPR